MEDLRKCWKVPYIVYFCNLFEQKLDLIDLRVDEFEEAIIDDCGTERNIVVIHLIQKLLKPFLNRSVDLTNYEQFLLTVLKRYNLEHLFLQEKTHNQWSELSMLTKLDIIYSLCEVRLQLSDTEAKLTEFEANELRIEPLGIDSRGCKLWYFGDLRLYEEKPAPKEKNRIIAATEVKQPVGRKAKKSVKISKQKLKKKKDLNKKKKKKGNESSDDDDEDEEDEEDEEEEQEDLNEFEMEEDELDNESEVIDVVEEEIEMEEMETKRRSERKSINKIKELPLSPPHPPPPPPPPQPLITTRTTRRTMSLMPKEAADLLLQQTQVLPSRTSTRRSRKATIPIEEETIKADEPIKQESEPKVEAISIQNSELENLKEEIIKEEIIKDEIIKEEEFIPFKPIESKVPVRLIDEKDEYKQELKYWSCVCLLLEDWQTIHDKYAQSKKKTDQEIAKLIAASYLPEMAGLFQKAEKERIHRLMAMAPKRQSQRLQVKQTNPDAFMDSDDQSQFSSNENSNTSNRSNLPLTEQERLKKEEIAKQREERLKQRLLKRDYINGDLLNTSYTSSHLNDETSQEGDASITSSHKENKDEFNIRNYFLMHKVLTKLLQCKYAWPFKNAVSEEDAPDYNKIIQSPMDLSTVQLKINSKTYKSRQAFCDDLELIVNNCLQYNGDDTYYGKLALKFENFFKRWLQIFYPREISTSLEEKNRQLMSLMSKPNGVLFHDLTNDENNINTNEKMNVVSNDVCGTENAQDATDSFIKFASPFDLRHKKKRPTNPDKDKYIQEPQYVTKRTSSGRLVKMKISTDYDYTSDQELEAKKKKKEEEDECEGIQQKHRIGTDNMSATSSVSSRSDSSSMSSNDRSDDEDFMGRKVANRKATPGARRGRGGTVSLGRGRPPRRTVKALTESGLLNNSIKFKAFNEYEEDTDDTDLPTSVLRHRNMHNYDDSHLNNQATSSDEQDDSDSDNDLRTLNLKKLNNSTNLFRRLTNISDDSPPSNIVPATKIGEPKQLTFEQYVKKLTGSYTLTNQPINESPTQNQMANTPTRLSLKIAPAPSKASILNQTTKLPLTIPIINPAIKAALTKFNAQQPKPTINSILTHQANESTIKVITVPPPPPQQPVANNSKFIVLSNEQTTQPNSLIKVINLSQFGNGINLKQISTQSSGLSIKTTGITANSNILSPILNKQIVMINNNSFNKLVVTQPQTAVVPNPTNQETAN